VPHKFFYISRVPEPVTFFPECSISYRFNRPVYSEAIRVAEYIRFRLESAYPTRAYTLKFESLPNVINTRKCENFLQCFLAFALTSRSKHRGLSCPCGPIGSSQTMLTAALNSRIRCFRLLPTRFMLRRWLRSTPRFAY